MSAEFFEYNNKSSAGELVTLILALGTPVLPLITWMIDSKIPLLASLTVGAAATGVSGAVTYLHNVFSAPSSK